MENKLKSGVVVTAEYDICREATSAEIEMLCPSASKSGTGTNIRFYITAILPELEGRAFHVYCRFQDEILVRVELMPIAEPDENPDDIYLICKEALETALGKAPEQDSTHILYEYNWGRIGIEDPDIRGNSPIIIEYFDSD